MKKKTLFIVLSILVFLGIMLFVSILIGRVRYQAATTESGYGYIDSYSGVDPSFLPSFESQEKGLATDELLNDADGSKIQKNGSISFLVEKIDESVESVKVINTKYLGQITNIYDYGRGNDRVVTITVKVPVTNFESYYEEIRDIDGEVTYANISTTDVTEEYIDITSRLKNLKSVETQLVEILQDAQSITDILAVQKELNTVRGEIESYEQRKRYFDSQTDYSYISISFSIDKMGLNISEDEWKPWGEFKAALNSLVSVLKGFVNMTIWLLVFSPIVLIPVGIVLYIVKRRKNTT